LGALGTLGCRIVVGLLGAGKVRIEPHLDGG
jgi:hypothetical protein